MKQLLHKINESLLLKILIAILLGVGLGRIVPQWFIRIFLTFSTFFGNLLAFSVPLILLGLIASTIASLGYRAGKMLFITLLLSYLSSFGSGMIAYFVSDATFPHLVSSSLFSNCSESISETIKPFFVIEIPLLSDTTSALVLAFILGLGGSLLHEDAALRKAMDDFRFLMERFIISTIIPFLPIYIFCLFLSMSFSGNMVPMFVSFSKIIGVIFVLHIGILLLQFSIAGMVVHRNPLKLLYTMFPAYFTALATSSSAAAIPITLKQTLKNGVARSVADFTIPLCATIHMSGSVLKITSCAVALMIMSSMPYDWGMFFHFVAMLCIMAVAAPGIPGGAIMAALPILSSVLGFSPESQTLMISLYMIMDSFGTACNVTGDGAIALIIDKINNEKTK